MDLLAASTVAWLSIWLAEGYNPHNVPCKKLAMDGARCLQVWLFEQHGANSLGSLPHVSRVVLTPGTPCMPPEDGITAWHKGWCWQHLELGPDSLLLASKLQQCAVLFLAHPILLCFIQRKMSADTGCCSFSASLSSKIAVGGFLLDDRRAMVITCPSQCWVEFSRATFAWKNHPTCCMYEHA